MTDLRYVIDASVFLASVRPVELHHRESLELFKRLKAHRRPVFVPSILPAEIAAGFSRNGIKPLRVRRLLALIQEQVNIQPIGVDENLGTLAAEVAIYQRIRGCDAIYVALAQVMNATLITLDEEQRQRIPATVIARSPAEELALLPPLTD